MQTPGEEALFWKWCQCGNLSGIMSFEYALKIDVNWANPDHYHRTGLHIATINEHVHVVNYLLGKCNVFPLRQDNMGCSAFFYAFLDRGNTPNAIKILKLFLEHPKINAVISNQVSLLAACWRLQWENVKYLLAGSALVDVHVTRSIFCGNKKLNFTAVDVALSNENIEVVTLMESYSKNPKEVRKKLRKELKWPSPSAEFFALCIFCCDNMLSFHK